MSLNKKWRNQFQRWKDNKESDEVVTRLLRRHRKLNIDLEVIQNSLSQIHRHVDKYLLDPRLLPLELLLHPESWSPSLNGINTLACLNNHRQLTSIEDLLTSGILNNILQGELSLYEDLPPIPIRAYQEGLNANHRQYCRNNKISALEHLATEGWQNFRNGRPVATG